MRKDEWELWQEHNRQVIALGGTIITIFNEDGTTEEWREINGQRVRNDPELKNALVPQ